MIETIDRKTYLQFIREALATEDIATVDAANKLALSAGTIDQPTYSAAAQILVDAYWAKRDAETN